MLARGDATAALGKIQAGIVAMESTAHALLESRSRAEADAFASASLVIVGGIVVSIVAASLFGWLLASAIAGPIRQMTEVMKRLAAGDMQVPVPSQDRQDEIGAMAGAVEVFKESMMKAGHVTAELERDRVAKEQRTGRIDGLVRTFEAHVGTMVGALSAGSTELKSTAESMTGTASLANEQATTVAAAAEQASVGVQTVASAAEELSASISEIGRQVAQSAKVTGRAVGDAQRTDAIVRALAEGAEKIGQVVGLITNIASQTNLAGAQRHDRGGACGRCRQGFCGGGIGGQEPGQPDRPRDRGHRHADRADPERDQGGCRGHPGHHRDHRGGQRDRHQHRLGGGAAGCARPRRLPATCSRPRRRRNR